MKIKWSEYNIDGLAGFHSIIWGDRLRLIVREMYHEQGWYATIHLGNETVYYAHSFKNPSAAKTAIKKGLLDFISTTIVELSNIRKS